MNTKKHYNNQYRINLKEKINKLADPVFVRGDLTNDKSNQEQLRLNRALKAFIDEGFVIKVAHGVFAKAQPINLPGGEVEAMLTEPFEEVATKTLDKLNIQWVLGSAIQEYNEGKTTQVPAVFSVRLKSRYRGSIKAEGRKLVFEGSINAR